MKEFITVAVFNFYAEIAVLKSVLINDEIPHYFDNETLVSIDPLASIAYGGIKLKIHPDYIEIVKKILDQLNEENNLRIV
jgi:hypothetical protein